MVSGRRCCSISPTPCLHKNRLPNEDKMNLVSYNNIRLKCYLNFVLYGSTRSGRSPMLARAIDYFYRVSNRLKKYKGWFYSNFLTITDISPSVISTFQSILSPACTSSTLTISLGNPTRRDLDFGFA